MPEGTETNISKFRFHLTTSQLQNSKLTVNVV